MSGIDEIPVSELFRNLTDFCVKMQQTEEIDVGIFEPLKSLYNRAEQMEDYWLLKDDFALYHMARNCKLVLRRMIQRWKEEYEK